MKPYFSRGTPAEIHYLGGMHSSAAQRALTIGALCCSVFASLGDESPVTNNSPYEAIVRRNAFDIKPPEPPAPVVPPAPTPPPPSNVSITGMMDSGGVKQVYFSVNKPGGKAPDYMVLKEGETQDDITVLAIDSKAETVKIRNGGNESTLNFRENGIKVQGPTGVPQPGAFPGAAPGVPQPMAPGQRAAVPGTPTVGGPVVVGKRGEVQSLPTPVLNGGVSTPNPGGDVFQPAAPGFPSPSGGVRELPVRRARIEGNSGTGIDPSTGVPVQEGAKPVLPPNFLPPLPR